jgi:predicted RecA/RadA family phage recombinase
MSALTADRDTPKRDGQEYSFPVAASTKIYQGAIVALNSSGYATKGATATTLAAVGVAVERADNSAGSAGDINVKIRRGVFKFGNSSSTDAIANTEYGANCYIVDDQTVAKTNGSSTRSVAGIVRGVDSDGVWVQF